jgi:integrase
MAMLSLLRRMNAAATTHGFRSSFRDWVGDKTNFPGELAELALAHKVGDATEQAYRRGDGFEKRRRMMDAWAKFCVGSQATTSIIQMRTA